jgi:nucleoside-diphosphate-sugar epimerase
MRYGVTGGAGFIGSTVVRQLLAAGHEVVVIDDFSAGKEANLHGLDGSLTIVRASIVDPAVTGQVLVDVDGIFHLAAVASVQRSIDDPTTCHAVNVTGTLNVLEAARKGRARRVVLSSSAAIYGDTQDFPIRETVPYQPISPYGLHKQIDELYARLYAQQGWVETVCLRYFNVYGPRQDPNGDYAAVVPKFITSVLNGTPPTIFGDGRQSRDFMYVEDVARANLSAMMTPNVSGHMFNVCSGIETDLNQLLAAIQAGAGTTLKPLFRPARSGDIRRSVGTDTAILSAFKLAPWIHIQEGLSATVKAFQEASATPQP